MVMKRNREQSKALFISRRSGNTGAGLGELTRTRIGTIARCTRQTIVVLWART
jgi:hypothetical protein